VWRLLRFHLTAVGSYAWLLLQVRLQLFPVLPRDSSAAFPVSAQVPSTASECSDTFPRVRKILQGSMQICMPLCSWVGPQLIGVPHRALTPSVHCRCDCSTTRIGAPFE